MLAREKFNLAPFAGENFNAWLFRIKSILRENGVIKAIEEADYASKDGNEEKEARAQAIIIGGVADSHLEYLRNQKTAYEMFKNLEENFKNKGIRSRLFLRRKLSEIKYNDRDSLQMHFVKLDECFSQLKDSDSEISDEEKINYILLSMPKSYENVVSAIETIKDLDLNFVKNRLLGEEEKRKKMKDYENKNVDYAFLCYYCHKPGHKKFQCRARQTVQGGNQNFGRQNFNQRGQESVNRRYQNNKSRSQSEHQAQRGYQGHNSSQPSSSHEDQRVAFMTGESTSNINKSEMLEWCIDSGCSDHLVNNKDVFFEYVDLKVKKKISAAKNGVFLEALGIGNIRINSYVNNVKVPCEIKNVYYVPEVKMNLLSVSKLEGSGLNIVFANNTMKAFYNNQIVMLGKKVGSLYRVEFEIDNLSCNYTQNKSINKINSMQLWHRRLGHLGYDNIKILSTQNLVNGLNINDGRSNIFESNFCESCLLGKMTRQPFNKKGHRATKPLELVHTDVCGPISPTTWDGYNYFLTFTDDFTHMVIVYLLKNKSEVLNKLKEYYNYATQHFNGNLLKLRSDNGGEYVSHELQEFCRDKGIKLEYTVPYNPQMNGVAERMNRTLTEKARTILIDSNLDKEMWGEAIYFSAYTCNRSPTSTRSKTPIELWEGRKPNINNLKVFGSIAYRHVPAEVRKKLDPKGEKLTMVGYAPNGAYRLWDADKRKVVSARSVIFNENKKEELVEIHSRQEDLRSNKEDPSSRPQEKEEENAVREDSMISGDSEDQVEQIDNKNQRKKRESKKPMWLNDFETNFDEEDEALFAFNAGENYNDIPFNFADIYTRKDKNQWLTAVQNEIDVLEESKTWVMVDKPKNIKPLDSKWVFTKKQTNNAEVYKARLVVKGFQQKGKLEDTYSPVLRLQTLRILLSVAVQRKYIIHQMDVKGAFLYGRIDEEVYLKPPLGINIKNGCVLKLLKSIYGLKKSPKYWYEHLHELITRYGFLRSENDYCLYSKDNLYILIYVDDLLIMGNNLKLIEEVKDFLKLNFRMKDMGCNNLKYLGISIYKVNDGLYIDQKKYLKNVLEKYRMENCNPIETPMDENFKIDKQCKVDLSLEKQCRSLIGSLMYATIGSRPDLAQSVYYLSRFQTTPCSELWIALKRVLRYIKGSLDLKLKYSKDNSNTVLVGYADADWARDDDRRSTSGHLFKIYNNTVIWKSKKQTTIALSTTEAEFISLCEASMEICWIVKLLKDLGISIEAVKIYEDNLSTIKAIKNPDQKRLKHMDIKFNFIKQKVEEGLINLEYINTQNQVADIFTKPVKKSIFKFLVNKLDLVFQKDLIEEEC